MIQHSVYDICRISDEVILKLWSYQSKILSFNRTCDLEILKQYFKCICQISELDIYVIYLIKFRTNLKQFRVYIKYILIL